MYFHRFYDDKLAQASYIIGCQQTGEALVVDPNRDVEQYVRTAAAEGLRITHVTETHIHADFVSGTRELGTRVAAQVLLSDEGGADWAYAFAAESKAQLLTDGDQFMVGNIRFDVLHTPGHTPEHISFVVTDTPANAGPWGILTGDFVFVGDVGRPDLLERAAGQAGTMEASARSLTRFRELPGHLQVWPGHGAGSACGKSLSAIPSSTVAYEKLANWGLLVSDETAFVGAVLTGQPEPPRYFAEMKRINREGPHTLEVRPRPHTLAPTSLESAVHANALLVDTRAATEFMSGHLPGAINIPLSTNFTTWAGSLLPYDRDILLLVDDANGPALEEALRALAMIGLDRVAGVVGSDALEAWTQTGQLLATVAESKVTEVAVLIERGVATLVDVRDPTEWEAGHVPGVSNIPLGQLVSRIGELTDGAPVVLHCQTGTRSVIAASLLQRAGQRRVSILAGGFERWLDAGLPVTSTMLDEQIAAPRP